MRRHFHWPVVCCLAFVLTNPSRPFIVWGSSPPRVMLEDGALEGIHFSSAPNEVAFLGVPYATCPSPKLDSSAFSITSLVYLPT